MKIDLLSFLLGFLLSTIIWALLEIYGTLGWDITGNNLIHMTELQMELEQIGDSSFEKFEVSVTYDGSCEWIGIMTMEPKTSLEEKQYTAFTPCTVYEMMKRDIIQHRIRQQQNLSPTK